MGAVGEATEIAYNADGIRDKLDKKLESKKQNSQ